ncbi:MAG: DUF302 domain-containing protein [Capnocytophaga sp.]|nr:DUF302 domain-containing protein [Capnocytophaga sp.]
MKKWFSLVLLCFVGILSAQKVDKQYFTVVSSYDFAETTTKIKNDLTEKGIKIFAEIDHTAEAQNVAMELPQTQVLVVGNPKVGTLLMAENQEIALHLPLKILIFEKDKKVFVRYEKINPLARRYKLKKSLEISQKIDETMANLLEKAVK